MAETVLRNPITTLEVPEGAKCVKWSTGTWSGRCTRPAKVMAYAMPSNHEPSPVCAPHAAGLKRRYQNEIERRKQYAAQQERHREMVERENVAANLATFLTEQLGVPLYALAGGLGVGIDIASAQKLYQSGAALFTRLSPSVAGPLWRDTDA